MQHLVAHILWVRRHEADSEVWRRRGHAVKKPCKVDLRTPRRSVAIRVHVLPQQRNVSVALRTHITDFAQYAFHISTSLSPPRVRHDAVGAEIIAPPHDRHKPRHMHPRQLQGLHVAVGLRCRERHIDSLLATLHCPHEVRQVHVCVWPCHEVYPMLSHQLLLHPFRHAAQYADD